MSVATATIAAASVVAAATFAGYATGSLRTVTHTVDDVLTRSEAPPPKKWKAVSKQRRDQPSSFEARVAGRTRPTPSSPSSRFERVLDERSAEQTARDATFQTRVGKGTAPAQRPRSQEFGRRVRGEPGASMSKAERSAFRAKVDRNRRSRAKNRAGPRKLPFQERMKGRRE